MNKTEQVIYNLVKNNVKLKQFIKFLYQSIFILIKPRKINTSYQVKLAEGYFFGFHDKSPWSANEKFILAHKFNEKTSIFPEKEEKIEIGYFTDINLKEFKILDKTHSWNWQQGSMLQWLGNSDSLIYNYWDGSSNKAKIIDINGRLLKILPYAIGAVSPNGKYVICYDFERLNKGMSGYGYTNESQDILDLDENIPENLGFRIYDVESDREVVFKSVSTVNKSLKERKLINGYLFLTHFIFSPNNERILFLIRSAEKGRRLISRLVTCDIKGEDINIFPCGDMVSHLSWVNSDKILAYCSDKDEKDGYFLFNDKSQEYVQIGIEQYSNDGHPNYSQLNNSFVTDSYPNRRRIQELSIFNLNSMKKILIGQFFSPIKYINEYRCDLHPRWDRVGEKICFDTTYTGERAIAIITLKKE